MRQKFFPVMGAHGFHRLAYTEWGDPKNPRVLICVHGLTRNSRDFDYLAKALASDWRVVCPDMPGRGESDWLPVKGDYTIATYLGNCAALIARLDVESLDWLGTSMGGIIGIFLASMAGTPLRRLIVNDIGPFIPSAGLQRILGFVGSDPRFADYDEAETYIKSVTASGIRSADHWRHIVVTNTRPVEGGGLRLHYDPGIGEGFLEASSKDMEFWSVWDAVSCPVLTLRGANSDILLAETAREMTERGAKTKLVEFNDWGHAPALYDAGQISVVKDWLLG
jgi:pimeloyl-ACP methyl ester carboxylesterase